ncbi:hypothetical protein TcG_01867 [Trypanosoma cruzi]|uniref:AB hydrolase-1 domain-containing protein n=2 Tax=Trypanosoma cruzi TaxID=5693 RepID=V5BBC2_TRYCR|nr:hypothetical protein TCDM_00679 [Trypanosoma cruzi Dm28c]KAF8281157.1 hypothetical protein TcBrA4_0090280 [Trypanosoma cruzi]PBJ74190.1 hypothetical protein BCY84_13025 [Trypanosoma cruzi cruzi]RNF22943.1 hypothetical protein TcG_01867 [Trypanosoma cruzi]
MKLIANRFGFLVTHCVVHLLFYVVPVTLLNLFFRWPITFLEWMIQEEELTFSSQKDRRIATVSSLRNLTVYDSFGLGSYKYYEGPMYSGHVHTILGARRPHCRVEYIREKVIAGDGNPLFIDCLPPVLSGDAQVRGLVLILPGLLSSSRSVYVQRMANVLSREGFFVGVLNARGVGDTPLEKPQIFSAVYTADLRHVLKMHFNPTQVQERLKSSQPMPFIALGLSLGGVFLCKYIGEQGLWKETNPLSAAIALTSPFDLNASDDQLSNSLYNRAFLRNLIAYAERHKAVMERLPGVDTQLLFKGKRPLLYRLRSVFQFDQYITAPHFGFRSSEEYYNAGSCFVSLLTSQIPVLCIATRDDPICGTQKSIRRWERLANTNANVAYVEMPSGGHLGFVGNPIAEFNNDANEGERLVLRSLKRFCENFQV